jgi:hypothetical protein
LAELREWLKGDHASSPYSAKHLQDPLFKLEMTELGWHDNTGEITPPEKVIDDILFCSEGDLVKLIEAARLALTDTRDLTMWVASLKASAKSK